jgi:TonB family protein
VTNSNDRAKSKLRIHRWIANVVVMVCAIMFLGTLSTPVHAQSKEAGPLGLSQVERLIQLQVPDAAVAGEIRRRGLNFRPSKETSDLLRRAGAGRETLQTIDELRPMLDEARKEIPPILANISQLLDQGNPQAARQLFSSEIANDAGKLDSICRPFTYKAHYIEAIIERPGQMFEVRVHVLFRPFDEKAQVFLFHPYQGTFLLVHSSDGDEDWFGPAKETAVQIVRNFIYAAKAQRVEVLANLVGSGLDASQFAKNPCWREALPRVSEVNDAHAALDSLKGLKIKVTVNMTVSTRVFTGVQAYFWVDRVNDQYRIVAAAPMHSPTFILQPAILFDDSPSSCRGLDNGFFGIIEGSELENDTLKRFGLPTSNETGHQEVYHVGGDVTAPVAASRIPEASCTEAGRKTHPRGEVNLKFVVDGNGFVKDIEVTKSLEPSLDESAMRALQSVTFRPGTRLGVPVAVHMAVDFTFSCN